MIKYVTLTLLILALALLTGCESELAMDLERALNDLPVPEQKPLPIVRAQTEAEVSKINNQAQRANILHEINLLPVELEADIRKVSRQRNIQLAKDTDITAASYKAADSLLKKLKGEIPKDVPILVASFVDIDDLGSSSTFGRLVSEQFASRFSQKGYATMEIKLRTKVFISQGSGQFLLSRELKDISNKHSAHAVVVGTYAVASSKVYLTARVVNFRNGRILASHDYCMPIGRNTLKILLKGSVKAARTCGCESAGEPDWL